MTGKTICIVVGAIVVALIAIKLLVVMVPLLLALALALIPVALAIAGLYSCLTSQKAANIKLLWIIIIILAPILGPLLWFLWGKSNT